MAAGGGKTEVAVWQATAAPRDGHREGTAETWHRATGAATGHKVAARRASDMAQATAGSATGAVVLQAGYRRPCSVACQWASAGTTAASMGAAAADSGSDSASGRAVGRHVAVAGTAGGCDSGAGRPWWAASPGGDAQACSVYRRVIRQGLLRGCSFSCMRRELR